MCTFALSVVITLSFIISLIGERLGDQPMTDNTRLFYLLAIALSWVMTCVVQDMKKK
jgi:hypothetical protein